MRPELLSGSASSFELVTASECCPQDAVTFECSVMGEGTTVFQGSALDCLSTRNMIQLLHSRFNITGGTKVTCNNGAIVGQSLRVEDNYYISQLRIPVSRSLVGKTIECIYDNGTATEAVGRYSTSTIIADRNGEYLNIPVCTPCHTVHLICIIYSNFGSTTTTNGHNVGIS